MKKGGGPHGGKKGGEATKRSNESGDGETSQVTNPSKIGNRIPTKNDDRLIGVKNGGCANDGHPLDWGGGRSRGGGGISKNEAPQRSRLGARAGGGKQLMRSGGMGRCGGRGGNKRGGGGGVRGQDLLGMGGGMLVRGVKFCCGGMGPRVRSWWELAPQTETGPPLRSPILVRDFCAGSYGGVWRALLLLFGEHKQTGGKKGGEGLGKKPK